MFGKVVGRHDKSSNDPLVPLTISELQANLDRSPFIAFLGLKVVEADPAREQLTMTCTMRPEFERGAGTGQWHGGPLAAIIDTVGDYALVMALRRGLPTINFRVDYSDLRSTPASLSPPGCGAPARASAWSMSTCSMIGRLSLPMDGKLTQLHRGATGIG